VLCKGSSMTRAAIIPPVVDQTHHQGHHGSGSSVFCQKEWLTFVIYSGEGIK
jgi:hypothetical protein